MLITVVIPTFNEAIRIAELVEYIRRNCAGGSGAEIIVVDSFSTDQTIMRATKAGARATQVKKGRAHQMNCGAAIANGEILFSLHSDTYPPLSFLKDILEASRQGYRAGCFRLSFDHNHWFLRLNSWFTRFDLIAFRFGDQGLFITRSLFQQIGGFNSEMLLLEDQNIIGKIKRAAAFKIFDRVVVTSARKYLDNGIFKLQLIFILIYFLYRLGISQQSLLRVYQRLVKDERMDATPVDRSKVLKQLHTEIS